MTKTTTIWQILSQDFKSELETRGVVVGENVGFKTILNKVFDVLDTKASQTAMTSIQNRTNVIENKPAYNIQQSDIDRWNSGTPTPGVETDPIYSASPAATITTAMINQWNSGLGTETDPVFVNSPAHGLTSDDLTKLRGYEATITALQTKVTELENAVNRLDNTLSDSIQNDG